MTNEQLQKAKKLESVLDILNDLDKVICGQNISLKDMDFFKCYSKEVNFNRLDEQTNKELKEAIKRVIVKRRDEIREEIAMI